MDDFDTHRLQLFNLVSDAGLKSLSTTMDENKKKNMK